MFINVLAIDVRDDVLIDSLAKATVGVAVNMLADVEVTMFIAVVITLDFSVSSSYTVAAGNDVWAGPAVDVGLLNGARVDFVAGVTTDVLARVFSGRVFAGAITSVVPNVDVLTDVSVNVVSGVMTSLEFTISP